MIRKLDFDRCYFRMTYIKVETTQYGSIHRLLVERK